VGWTGEAAALRTNQKIWTALILECLQVASRIIDSLCVLIYLNQVLIPLGQVLFVYGGNAIAFTGLFSGIAQGRLCWVSHV